MGETPMRGTPAPFRFVHRHVRFDDQFFGHLVAGAGEGHSDTGRHGDLCFCQRKRSVESRTDTPCVDLDVRCALEFVTQEHELVA